MSHFLSFDLLVSEKQFSASDGHALELSEELIERRVIMKTFHTFLRYHFPEYEPHVTPCHFNNCTCLFLSHYFQKTKITIWIDTTKNPSISTIHFIVLLVRVPSRTLFRPLNLSASWCLSASPALVRESQLEQSRLSTSERADSVASAPV